MEPLEARQMLSMTWPVSWDHDEYEPAGDADGQRSLREAIVRDAQPGDTIKFDSSLAGHTILLDHDLGEIAFAKSLTIDGRDTNGVSLGIRIDASDTDPTPLDQDPSELGDGTRIFYIGALPDQSPPIVTTIGLTLTGGDPAGDGGAIRSQGLLTLQDCNITGNFASLHGGGVWERPRAESTTARYMLTIDRCVIAENSTALMNAFDSGGGVYAAVFGNDKVTIESSSNISDNDAMNGGGIAIIGLTSFGENPAPVLVLIRTQSCPEIRLRKGGAGFTRSWTTVRRSKSRDLWFPETLLCSAMMVAASLPALTTALWSMSITL